MNNKYSIVLNIFLLIVFMNISTNIFAKEPSMQSEEDRKILANFWVYVETSKSITDIENKIDEYLETYKDNPYLASEAYISKINIFSEFMSDRETLAQLNILDAQWENYAAAHELKSEEYRTWGSLKNTKLSYLPLKQLITESKIAQEYFEKAMDLDKNNAMAYIQLGTWCIYSPKVAGGGMKKAIKYLKKGIDKATTDFEKYQGNLWLSQAYFKLGEKGKKDYEKSLADAKAIYGETSFYQILTETNAEGKIIGE